MQHPDPAPPSRSPVRALARWWPVPVLAAALALGAWAGWSRHDSATAAAVAGHATPKPTSRLPQLAQFGDEHPPADVQHVADWVMDSGDHGAHAFVLVDKKQARVWLFDPAGQLVAAVPALLGAAVGDDPVPGIGDKPLAEVQPEEKTTPAGRFVAEPGVNAGGEDVVWVSYDLAVSMHRVRATVKSEHRLERLASATADDNRISFGCINLPPAFYEQQLRPTVERSGAVVYVLPETRSPQQQFGSYEVVHPAQLAIAAPPARVK